MRLEIDDADGLVALAVDAQNLNLLVGGRTVRLVDIGVVDAGIRAHPAVLHEITAAEGYALGGAALIRKLRRLQIAQGVHRRIGDAGNGHAAVNVGDFVLTASDRRRPHLLLHGKMTAVMSVRSVKDDGVAIETSRLHHGVAHVIGDSIGQGLGIKLHDNGFGVPVGKSDTYDFKRIKHFFSPAILVISRHEHAERRGDIGFGVTRLELYGENRCRHKHRQKNKN